MNRLSGRPADDEIERIVTTYEPGLFRLCLMMLGREMDAEDAVSETMIRYIGKAPDFHDSGHERAWLYTVAATMVTAEDGAVVESTMESQGGTYRSVSWEKDGVRYNLSQLDGSLTREELCQMALELCGQK